MDKKNIFQEMDKSPYIPVLNDWKGMAFLPIIVFLCVYIGSGVYYDLQGVARPFTQVPRITAAFIALLVALLMGRKETFGEKVLIIAKSAGDHNVILMCFIFMLSGAFAGVSKAMGGVDSTVNMGLQYIPAQFMIAGVFLISCFVALSLGTSMGTIATIGPIAVSIAEKAGLPQELAIAAVIGGAMFGDNLSIISDTTIAACRGQGAEMRDKFIMNFKIAIPAALACAFLYVVMGDPAEIQGEFPFQFIKVVPYLAVLAMALIGVDVFIVLLAGTVFSGLVGFFTGSLTWVTFAKAAGSGIGGMLDIVALCMVLKGLAGLATANGGLKWLVSLFAKSVTTKKRGEVAIAGMVTVVDMAIANNTVAIVIANPVAKEFADRLGISPKRTASILDIFACAMQGVLPHSGQILLGTTLTSVSPLAIMGGLYYQFLLAIFALLAIYFGIPKEKETKPIAESDSA